MKYSVPPISIIRFLLIALITLGMGPGIAADKPDSKAGMPYEVLTLLGAPGPHELAQDRGAVGLWQKLLKLRTTASAIHVTAHPDDEHGGVLTFLSRGQGVRTSLLTLNRGEAGANAIGPELFDGLGLIRTEELLISDRYYGLEDQYFTSVIDYGYSKRLDEALEKWGRENVLRDAVRVVRINRPLVIISRFHGSERDGHGNHQTSGLIAQEIFEAAGDPNRFPEQIREERLRPWQPLKLYRGGIRANEKWHVRINEGEYSPWLGTSYQQFAALGLSFQRSQTSGRMRERVGVSFQHYERVHSRAVAQDAETSFFDGIDTSLPGITSLPGVTVRPETREILLRIGHEVDNAFHSFNVRDPSAAVPPLARALKLTREAITSLKDQPDAVFVLRIKELQFMDAINCALGVSLNAAAVPSGSEPSESPWAPPATMGPVVPGQTFKVDLTLSSGGSLSITPTRISVHAPQNWTVKENVRLTPIQGNGTLEGSAVVTVAGDAELSRPNYFRNSIQESRYKLRNEANAHLPSSPPPVTASAAYTVEGVPVTIRSTVRAREPNLPFGHVWRELSVTPAVAVNVEPDMRIVPLGQKEGAVSLDVELIHNAPEETAGSLQLKLPAGWKAQPEQQAFRFTQPGQRSSFSFSISVPRLEAREYPVEAVATAGGREYRSGYQVIRHRDLETRRLYREAKAAIRGVDVTLPPGMKVGYVMGVGDEVPSGIEQMGADVQLLGTEDLARGDLRQFHAIVIGTRAYAVRDDLITYNHRLLDYARQGGNLVVLYQTQEFIPGKWAPYPADLPRGAEEVAEEDSPVKILASDHSVFNRPNKITAADFNGWVEQRGSKFLTQWNEAYIPMIETQDRDQAPQRGGWLTARHGSGHYTYFAYAVHRQLPYGVSGAFRIFANVLALGR